MKKYNILILIIIFLIYFIYQKNSFNINEQKTLVTEGNIITIESSEKGENTTEKLIIDEMKESDVKRDFSKVKISINKSTITAKGLVLNISDENEKTYVFDSWFEIEKLENNEWKKLKYLENYIENDMSEMIYKLKNGKLEEHINWLDRYGTLSSGKYKLKKRCIGEENKYKYLEIEFTIE